MLRTEAKITVETARQIWEDVRATVPLGTDRMKHGTLAMAGYWTGSFTQTQLDEFNRRTQKIIRAARKAQKAAA
ncbi:hypothetical protein [Deinococcus altitudinis]|uniref:hypothetical protein n=1 Tax=Deinococcus altitudinis TaxID=468914 RepID=UPI0038925420